MTYSVDIEKNGEKIPFHEYKSGLFLYNEQLYVKTQTSGGNQFMITRIDGTPLFDSSFRNDGRWTYRVIQPCKIMASAGYKRFWVSWYCDPVDFGECFLPITVWGDDSTGIFCCFAVIDIPLLAFLEGEETSYINQNIAPHFSNFKLRFVDQKINDFHPGPDYASDGEIRTKF